MTSYTFKTLPLEVRDTKFWRRVDLSQMSEEQNGRFTRLKIGIETYLTTGRLKEACRVAGCAESTLLKQLNRCVTKAADNQIFGWVGLIKYRRVKEYQRKLGLPSGTPVQAGNSAGAFQAFLVAYPDIQATLDALILKTRMKGHTHEARIRFKGLTRSFRNLCIKHGVQESQYPLNSASKARQSVTRYAKELVAENAERGTWARFGDAAWKHLRVGTGRRSPSPFPLPMRVWGLDAHKIDCIGCVIVPGPAGPQRIPIQRIWFVPVLDSGARTIMGYSVGIRKEISSDTVEQALINGISEWKPKDLTSSGIRYSDSAALPSFVFPELIGCAPAMLKVDNALQHYATRVIERARQRLGCSFSWGGIGRWDHNSILERLFRTLENYGFQRLPSTTGSNPMDTIKTDAVKEALKYGIEWHHLLEFLDVIVAEYNATPNRGLGGQTPLSVLQNFLDPARPMLLLRPLPEATMMTPELGTITITPTVRGNQSKGVRPYIQYEHARYTNPQFAHSFHMVGKRIVVHLKSNDVSKGEAFSIDGEPLGQLVAEGQWGRVPHSADIRKEISRLINDAVMWMGPGDDPVQQLLQTYSNKASQEVKMRPKSVSNSATKLARFSHETSREIPPSEDQTVLPKSDPAIRSLTGIVKPPSWKTIT